jgi:hypothetical protein
MPSSPLETDFTFQGRLEDGSGAEYGVHGTIGQYDVGDSLSGGSYTIDGGFGGTGGETKYEVFLPLTVR